eukprot:RCo037452
MKYNELVYPLPPQLFPECGRVGRVLPDWATIPEIKECETSLITTEVVNPQDEKAVTSFIAARFPKESLPSYDSKDPTHRAIAGVATYVQRHPALQAECRVIIGLLLSKLLVVKPLPDCDEGLPLEDVEELSRVLATPSTCSCRWDVVRYFARHAYVQCCSELALEICRVRDADSFEAIQLFMVEASGQPNEKADLDMLTPELKAKAVEALAGREKCCEATLEVEAKAKAVWDAGEGVEKEDGKVKIAKAEAEAAERTERAVQPGSGSTEAALRVELVKTKALLAAEKAQSALKNARLALKDAQSALKDAESGLEKAVCAFMKQKWFGCLRGFSASGAIFVAGWGPIANVADACVLVAHEMSRARARKNNLALVTPPPSPPQDEDEVPKPPQHPPEPPAPERVTWEHDLANEFVASHEEYLFLKNLMPEGPSLRPELGRITELLLFGGQPRLYCCPEDLNTAVVRAIASLLFSKDFEKGCPYQGVLVDVRQFGQNVLRFTGPADFCPVIPICGTSGRPWYPC